MKEYRVYCKHVPVGEPFELPDDVVGVSVEYEGAILGDGKHIVHFVAPVPTDGES